LYLSPPHLCSTLFPYTTLFRSLRPENAVGVARLGERQVGVEQRIDEDDEHRSVDVRAGQIDRTGRAVNLARPYVHGPVLIIFVRSEEHTSELQSRGHLVCRLLL